MFAEEYKRRQEEIKAREEEDRQKEEEKNNEDGKESGATEEASKESETDELSKNVKNAKLQGDDQDVGEYDKKKQSQAQGHEGSQSRSKSESEGTEGVGGKGQGPPKKAAGGKGKGKKVRRGKKKGGTATSVHAGENISEDTKAKESGKKEETKGKEKDTVEVELSGEKVHVVGDVTAELQALEKSNGEAEDEKAREDNMSEIRNKEKGRQQGKSITKAPDGKEILSFCPFGVSSGIGRLRGETMATQDSIESTDSFDERLEKGQALPAGHPPVDIASLAPVGANAQARPMMDMRMFCPNFADQSKSEKGEIGDEDQKQEDDDDMPGCPFSGGQVDMDEFLKGFQDFLEKKKQLEKKVKHIDSSSEDSD